MSTSKAQELLQRIAQQKEEIAAIQAYWASIFPEFSDLTVRQCQVWLKLYTFDQVVEGIDTTNIKINRPNSDRYGESEMSWDVDRLIQYASGCMKGVKTGRKFDHTGEMSEEVKPVGRADGSNMMFEAECGCDVNHLVNGGTKCPAIGRSNMDFDPEVV